MIMEIRDSAALYGYEKKFPFPYHFPAAFDQWERSMFRDTDGAGRTLFRELKTIAAVEDGEIVGYAQYGRTAFGFDDSGEISGQVSYSVIRMLWFDGNREEAGRRLLGQALEDFQGEGRVYAFFHYFGMSCYARHGKLFQQYGYIDRLLRQSGFSVEHENVYYSSSLADDPEGDIRIVWGEKTSGEQRTACFFDGEQWVGECEVHYVCGGVVYLRWIYIDAALQNRGIGSRCIRSLKNTLTEEGFTRLDTDTAVGNLRARHFYEKNGFSREGITRSYYRDFSE